MDIDRVQSWAFHVILLYVVLLVAWGLGEQAGSCSQEPLPIEPWGVSDGSSQNPAKFGVVITTQGTSLDMSNLSVVLAPFLALSASGFCG